MDNYIGRLLDNRYELLEIIGTGGMAVVFKARDNRLNRLVAIKILKDELSENEEFRRRFQAESQAVAMLSHPNIVSVYDVSHSDNQDYIVMELIEGISLKQYLEQKGVLNWREALHFSTQIARALEHAHAKGLIHRDIKPHNIMLLKDGSVKVADFGIARVSSAQHTLTREALGSVHYISPEQAKGAAVDCRSDLYSLGVVMYEMLVGRPPYDGETPVSVAIQHINAKAEPPRSLNPSIPEGLEQITMHAMCSELSDRYASASQLLRDLEEFRKNPNVLFDFSKGEGGIDVGRLINDKDYIPVPATYPKGEASVRAVPQPPKPKKKDKDAAADKRGSRIAVIAGIVCIALAMAGIAYFLYNYFISDLFAKTEEDIVPTLVGEYFDTVDQSRYPSFVFETEWKASDFEYGYIMDQKPSGGRNAKVGSTVELVVSMGPESNTMPNLVNLSLQNASDYLDSMHIDISVEVEYRSSDVYTEGYIIETIPARDEELTAGQKVTLVVSQGVEVKLVEVPSVVGFDQDEALRAIDKAGLGRGSIRYDDSDLPEGTVIFQSIDPGLQVKAETVINLRVSKGPQTAMVPFVMTNSRNMTVNVGDEVKLEISAKTTDDGSLSYTWYVARTAVLSDAQILSANDAWSPVCTVNPAEPGTYYYFCRVVNTLGESTASADSDIIEIVVEEPVVYSRKTITVKIPMSIEAYTLTVKSGEETLAGPFRIAIEDMVRREMQIELTGTGVQQIEIYKNDTLLEMQTVDFDAVDEE